MTPNIAACAKVMKPLGGERCEFYVLERQHPTSNSLERYGTAVRGRGVRSALGANQTPHYSNSCRQHTTVTFMGRNGHANTTCFHAIDSTRATSGKALYQSGDRRCSSERTLLSFFRRTHLLDLLELILGVFVSAGHLQLQQMPLMGLVGVHM